MDQVTNSSFWDFKGNVDYVDEWFLMATPGPVLTILAFYLFFVLKLGPDYMKNRPPFNLYRVLIVYNIVQVILSARIFVLTMSYIVEYGLVNTECSMNLNEVKYIVTNATYLYFSAKVSELLDTVFFVLRKKQNQVTFLHVYHHSSLMIATWFILKYEPNADLVFLGGLNSFVHIIMYAYYCLSAIPGMEPYLWWKKYITIMQLVQFILIILQVIASAMTTACPPSNLLLYITTGNTAFFLYMFNDFYFRAYIKNKGKKIEDKNI